MPTVHVLVVNYNGWTDTIECLESLLASQYPALRILVLDNASTDGSIDRIREWARARSIDVVRCTRGEIEGADRARLQAANLLLVDCGSNLGFAGANNIGLRHMLRSESPGLALLLNNDAIVAADAIRAMVDVAHRVPAVGAVGATILRYHEPECVETLAGATLNRVNGMARPIHAGADRRAPRPSSLEMDYVSGCCMLVSAAAIDQVGLMDERYFLYSEDADWGLRMRRARLHLAYAPAAEVWHKGGATVVHRSAIHDYYAVRASLMLMQKHFPGRLPLALAHSLWRSLLPKVARRQWSRLGAVARGYRDFLAQALRNGRDAA